MKKTLITTLAGFAAVGSLNFAASANADNGMIYGDCWVDAYGRCMFMTPDQVTPRNAPADRAAYGSTPDQRFAYYVTHDESTPWFVIMDFELVKAQGLRNCQLQANGVDSLDALYDIQRSGGYTFDQANNIASSAEVIYCPWVNPPPGYRPAPAPFL